MPRSPITKLKPFNLDSTANYTFTNASVAGIINVGAVQTNSLLYSNGQPWSFSGGGGSGNTIPGGETGAVQFNGGGNFAGSSQFTFNTNTNTLFVNNIQSNGSLLTNLPGSNVTGQVGNALVSGTVYNNAQPNITSVGTLTSLTVTGNVSASYFVGNGSTLTGINGSNVVGDVSGSNHANVADTANSVSGSNVIGQVSNALIAGTVYTNSQPNITSVGTLTSLSVSGNISGADAFFFDTANAPNVVGVGQLSWNDGDGTLDIGLKGGNVILQVGQELLARVYNAEANTLVDGEVVYISGAQGNRIKVNRASANAENSSYGTLGMVTESIASGSEGFITTVGVVRGLNTSSLAAGALVYLSPTTPGAYTTTKPTAPNHTVVIGYVQRVHASQGSIYVKVDNGYELDELHNVLITSPTNGQSLVYDNANSVWVNGIANIANIAYSVSGSNVAGTVANANYATYSGTAYSVSASNVSGLGNIATINLDGNVSNILRGDGSWGPESSSTNANYANFAGTAFSVSASNISGTVANANFATYANYATFSGTATTADTANSVSGSNVTGQVSNSLVAGTVYTNSQPNITSVGTLTSLTVTGNVTASYFIGNGSQLTGLPVTYSNANVAAYLPTYTGNFTAGNATITGTLAVPTITTTGSGGNISGADYIVANYFTGTLTTNAQPNITSVGTLTSLSVTGNVTASYFIGNGSTLSSINGSNVTGQVGNSLVAGTVYTNAQPNITSLGTLTSLTVTGNVSASYFIGNGSQLTGLPASYSNANVAAYLPTYTGNLLAGNANITGTLTVPSITTSGSGGNITGADYIIANYFNGNGSLLSGIIGANVTGTVSSATSATTAGTVTTASQPNITSVGSLTGLTVSGDATVSGNLTVGGNTSYINVTVLSVKDPIIELGGGTNGAPLSTNDGKDRGTLLHYYTSTTVDAFMGWDNSNAEFAFGSNVSVSSEVVTFNSYGNLRAGYFIGDGSQLTGLPASYSNSNVAAYLLTNTGNISAGYFIGDGSTLTNITAANVIGQVSNALVSGTVYTNSQPNITSLGTLTSLTVNGTVNLGSVANVNISGGSNGQLLTTYGNGALYWGNATSGSPAQFTIDTFTGDGTTTTYTLSTTPSGIDNLIVNYNGSFQLKNAYTLSGANITFTGTPNTGSTIEVFTLTGSGGGGGGGSALTIKDEGSTLSTAVTSIDFVGSGVTATNVGNAVTVSVSGASNTSIRAQAMTMGILFGG